MRLAFLGNGPFGLPTLRALHESPYEISGVVCRPDRPAGRGRKPELAPTKALALDLGLEIIEVADLKAPDTHEVLDRLPADLWVVVAFPILPGALLGIPPMGTVNLHGSLLPRYRGAAPIQWAVIEGERATGVTTFFIDPGVDTGAICLQREVAIEPEETAGELAGRLADIGADLMIETLACIETGDAPRLPQDDQQATRAPKLTKADGKLDWGLSARQLVNRVHGLNPWPGGHTYSGSERLAIHRARVVGPGDVPWNPGDEPPPGGIGGFTPDGLPVIAAGDGAGVALVEIQRPGRRSVGGADGARGLHWKSGERLGEQPDHASDDDRGDEGVRDAERS